MKHRKPFIQYQLHKRNEFDLASAQNLHALRRMHFSHNGGKNCNPRAKCRVAERDYNQRYFSTLQRKCHNVQNSIEMCFKSNATLQDGTGGDVGSQSNITIKMRNSAEKDLSVNSLCGGVKLTPASCLVPRPHPCSPRSTWRSVITALLEFANHHRSGYLRTV